MRVCLYLYLRQSIADFEHFVEVYMVNTLKLPVGIDSFEKIRKNQFYYIDKTKLIEQLVETGGEVTLFTRPRRFGKTLNMSMLRHCLMDYILQKIKNFVKSIWENIRLFFFH